MEQNRFFKVMRNSSSYSNINGIENSKGENMSFEKINDQPGIGQLQIRDNNYIKKYMFSDHPIINEMRTRKKKRETLKKRLEQFLTQHRIKKQTTKASKSKKKQKKAKRKVNKKQTEKQKEKQKENRKQNLKIIISYKQLL